MINVVLNSGHSKMKSFGLFLCLVVLILSGKLTNIMMILKCRNDSNKQELWKAREVGVVTLPFVRMEVI